MPFGNPFGYGMQKREFDPMGGRIASTTGPGDGMAPPGIGQRAGQMPWDLEEFRRRNRSRSARMASLAAGGMAGLPSFLRTGSPFGSSSMSRSY